MYWIGAWQPRRPDSLMLHLHESSLAWPDPAWYSWNLNNSTGVQALQWLCTALSVTSWNCNLIVDFPSLLPSSAQQMITKLEAALTSCLLETATAGAEGNDDRRHLAAEAPWAQEPCQECNLAQSWSKWLSSLGESVYVSDDWDFCESAYASYNWDLLECKRIAQDFHMGRTDIYTLKQHCKRWGPCGQASDQAFVGALPHFRTGPPQLRGTKKASPPT